jgi:predicted phage terminase large subunit-like protein
MIELVSGQSLARAQAPIAQPQLRHSPHQPTAKQQTFLSLLCREALFGGAAGGGKSEALLMAALQYVHVPGYAALVLRKDTQRLALAGGLIPRAQAWLAGTGAKWNEAKLTWTFPTAGAPATLSFGYLNNSSDKYRYGSSEYQYIAFDELTEFAEDDYRFLFSRLRSTRQLGVPLRMRAASNPGGPGHAWVKGRFIGNGERGVGSEVREETIAADRRSPLLDPHVFYHDDIAFVPATIADNPALNADEYRRSLAHLPTIVRERLERGDWSIREDGLLRHEWLRYYVARDRRLDLLDARGERLVSVDERYCRRFVTIDPAGTSADRAREKKGKAPSFTVLQVWDQPQQRELASLMILRHVVRKQVGFDGLCQAIIDAHRQWRPLRILIENEKLGRAAYDVLRRRVPIECVATGGRDKVTRAAPLIAKLERGEVFLPRTTAPWLVELETEWLGWTGLDDDPSDQIDAAAYAAQLVDRRRGAQVVRLLPIVISP